MNEARWILVFLSGVLITSGASGIELNSSEALKYYGQGTQDFRVSPGGNTLIPDGTLNISKGGEPIANFTENDIRFYKPVSIRSNGPFSVANGIELNGEGSNAIESFSTFYLRTSSGSASDIVLEPTGQVGIGSNLETTGNISVGGDHMDLEGGDIQNIENIETSQTEAMTFDNSQNIRIPNGNLEMDSNNILNPDQVDGVDLDDPGNSITINNDQLAVQSGAISDNEIEDDSVDNTEIENTATFTFDGVTTNSDLDMASNNITNANRIGDSNQGNFIDFDDNANFVEIQDTNGNRNQLVTQDTFINEDGFWLGDEDLVNISADEGLSGGGTNGLTDGIGLEVNAGDDLSINNDDVDLRNSIDLNRIDFGNEESATNSDGAIAFDSSEGLIMYRTQQPGDVSGNDDYLILDRSNIKGGNALGISGGKGDGSAPVKFNVSKQAVSDEEIEDNSVDSTEIQNSDTFSMDSLTSVSDQNAIKFANGDSRITNHDGHGNFNIRTGTDNSNNIVAGTGGTHIRMDENGGVDIEVDESTGTSNTMGEDIGLSINDGSVDIRDGNLDMNDDNIDNIASIDGGGDAIQTNDNLNLNDNNLDDVASIDGNGDAIQTNDQVQLNDNRLKTDTNGNYIEGDTASFSRLESGSGGEIDVRSTINFNNVNMKNIQFEDAGDLDSSGNTNLEFTNINDTGGDVTVTSVDNVEVDEAAGFELQKPNSDTARLTMGSHWKTIYIDGKPSPKLVPSGQEPLGLNTTNELSIAADSTASPQTLTFDLNAGNILSQATDLESSGDISDGSVQNAELDNSQLTVAGNTVSLGSSTAVSVNDLSDVSSSSETAGQTLLYDANNNQYTNARITAGQGLGRTTSNGDLTVSLNPGNGIETNSDTTRVNPQHIAGDGLKETSATSLGVEPANFAGSFLSDDGSDNLQVNTGTFISGDGNGNIDVDISNGLQDDGSGNIEVNWNDADDLNSQGKISDFSEATDLGSGGDISDDSVQDAELDLANGLTVAGGAAGDGSQSGLRVDGNGNLYFSGSLNFPGDTNIISAQELNGSFVPSQGAQFNIGSSSKRWKNGYFSGTVNTDFVQKAGGEADIEFAGSGRIDIRNSNNNDIIRARDSGEIDIPRGNIDVSGGTVDARGGGDLLNDGFRLEENGVLKSRRSDGNLYFDIESGGGTTRLRDSGDGDIIRANDNGNVEIPNGGVDIGAPTDTGRSLDVGGGARFAGDIDVNDNEISNLDLQNVNNIEMDGNIQGGGVDMSLQEVGSILGPNNGDTDLNIQTQGGGGHVVSIEDGSSSNSDIARFKEGSQNVEIPNGNLSIEGSITEIGGKGTNEIRDDGDLVVDSDDKIEFADNGNTYMEVGASASEGDTQIDTDGDVTTNGRLDANSEGGEISDDSGSSMDVQKDGDVVVTLG